MQEKIIPVIIPCRNEIKNLKRLVKLLKNLPENFTPILVDNGSTDGSVNYAINKGLEVVSEPRIGYGYACKKGISYVNSIYPSSEFIAFYDADISENPEDLILLLKNIKKMNLDLILGSRHVYYNRMPSKARSANQFFAKLINIFYRFHLHDNGPMRIIKKDLLNELDMKDIYYGWTFEMTIKVIKLNKRIAELPIRYYGRYEGESKISGNIFNSLLSLSQILFIFTKYLF